MSVNGPPVQHYPAVIVSFDDDFAMRFARDLEPVCPTLHVSPLLKSLKASIESLQPSILIFDLQTVKTEEHSIFEIMVAMNEAFPEARKIGLGYQNIPTQIILAMKSGACDFLDRESTAEEICETVRAQLSQARNVQGNRAGRVIALVGGRENDGESEIAANLAAHIASTHPKGEVLLLDLTLEDSQLEIEFNVEITYSVRDAIEEHLRLDKVGLVDVLAKHSSGLCLLPLTTSKSKDGEISPQQIATLLGALRNFFSIIVINAGCLRDKYCRQYVLPLCDRVLLVCPQTIGSIRTARQIAPSKTSGEHANVRFGLIVSKYDREIELTPDQIAARIGIPLVATIPTSWVSLANSHNLGVPLVISWSGSRYARAIRELADHLLDATAAGTGAKAAAAGPLLRQWLGALKRASF